MSSGSRIRRPRTFEPEKFEATALIDLINQKRAGKPRRSSPTRATSSMRCARVAPLATYGTECSCDGDKRAEPRDFSKLIPQ